MKRFFSLGLLFLLALTGILIIDALIFPEVYIDLASMSDNNAKSHLLKLSLALFVGIGIGFIDQKILLR